jgi:putative hydrolase of HD superfamily
MTTTTLAPAAQPERPASAAAGPVLISRAQHRWYVLGAPTAARLAQSVAAARAGQRVGAVTAGVLAGVSLVASLAFTVLVLYAGWRAATHHDVSDLVLPALVTAVVAEATGLLAEVPVLTRTAATAPAPAGGGRIAGPLWWPDLAGAGRRPVGEVADTLLGLGQLALAFGRVDRITFHPDGTTPESDTDHTVMVALAACALAGEEPGLDVGLVAQFALVHDLVEVYAGDVPTLRALSPQARADKHRREAEAYERIRAEFGGRLPWLHTTIHHYERQDTPEARFVRALDKLMPKLTHLRNNCRTLHQHGTTVAELAARYTHQREDELASYAADFPVLLALHAELAARVVALYRGRAS